MKFNENLTKYRKRAGLTQNQLASKLSVTPQAVSKWEKGGYPDMELLPKISRILDVSLDILFGLKENENKINIARISENKLQQLSDEKKGQFIIELFYGLICAYNKNTSPEDINFPESFVNETYAHLRTNYELAISRLNPDMQYLCFMRIPEKGINSYFKIQPRIIELFSFLSDENALRIISYAETLGRNCVLTKACIAKELSIPIDITSDIVDRFERFGIMWQLTASTCEGSFPIYGYVHNIPLVGILTLAESLVNFLRYCEPDIDTWTEAPFKKINNDENNK